MSFNLNLVQLTVMECSLLLHERYKGLACFRDKESLLLRPFLRELRSPNAFEVSRVGQHQLSVLSDCILRKQIFDVVLGDTGNPCVNVFTSRLRILIEFLRK